MKLELTKDDVFDVLQSLNDRKKKYMSLAEMSSSRKGKTKFMLNAETLRKEHVCKQERAQELINKIINQL